MASDTAKVQGRCPSCKTVVTWDEDTVTDETMLVCPNCGLEVGTYGDFKEKALEAVRDRMRASLKDAFKGS